jgi:YHS domain-containing protein
MPKTRAVCTVCATVVGVDELVTEYHKVYYHLCSDQCKETFIAHPRLYTGKPGADRRVKMKCRMLKMGKPMSADEKTLTSDHLHHLVGIKKVDIKGSHLYVTYDLLQITEMQIEQALQEAGAKLGGNWLHKLNRAWIHYSEETELDNLAAPSTPCCNHPPPGSTKPNR